MDSSVTIIPSRKSGHFSHCISSYVGTCTYGRAHAYHVAKYILAMYTIRKCKLEGNNDIILRTVFSLAYMYMYLRHVGPTSLQYGVPFDVGMG